MVCEGAARVAVPAAQVQESVNRIITVLALIGIVGAALAVLIGYRVVLRTSRSINALTEASRQLTAGELDYRVHAQGSDETQELGTSPSTAWRRLCATWCAIYPWNEVS